MGKPNRDYDRNEKYFAYHIVYYFLLLTKRREIEENVVQIKDRGKKLSRQLRKFPMDIPDLDLTQITETTEVIDNRLRDIADIVNERWKKIRLNAHNFFKLSDYARDNLAYYYDGFPVEYLIPRDKFKDVMGGASELVRELKLGSRKYTIDAGGFLTCHFDSIEDAIDTTKKYLLEHLED